MALLVIASSVLLVRATWKGSAGMHPATIAYAVVISAMVISAWATVGGKLALAPAAAIGALLFYSSDSTLALNRFRRPIPHIPFFAIGVSWLGQLGLAIAASASF